MYIYTRVLLHLGLPVFPPLAKDDAIDCFNSFWDSNLCHTGFLSFFLVLTKFLQQIR